VTATGAAAAYSSPNVGTYAGVVITYTLADGSNGGLAVNYSLANGSATGQVTAKPLSVTAPSIASRAYNRTATAGAVTVGTLSGFVGTQTVTATGVAADYSSASIGTYAGVVITYTLADGANGGLAANYSLANGSATGVITAKELTVANAPGKTFAVSNKVYDGGKVATVDQTTLALVGVESGDTVTLTATADFADKNVANGKTVSLTSSSAIGGANSGNYSLSIVGAPTTTANITQKLLSIGGTLTAQNKIYDAGTSATLNTSSLTLVGVESGDTGKVALTGMSGAFATKIAESNKLVTITVAQLTAGASGDESANYSVTVDGAPTARADITQKPLTISGLGASNKQYDGGFTATVTGSAVFPTAVTPGSTAVDGAPYTGDTVSLSGTAVGTFTSKNVADGISVTFAGLALTETDSANYTLTAHANGSANITKRPLSVDGSTIATREYDGTTTAGAVTVGTVSNLVSGESLTITGAAANYSDSIAGTYTAVTITYTLNNGTGGLAGNYSLADGSATGIVSRKTITVTADELNKTYSTPAASDPATFTYSVSPSITGLAALSGTLTRQAGEDAGQYDV
ncbi:MAG: beta strand repeat-containing protein, partial [Ilumatobacteraceae bacterium]